MNILEIRVLPNKIINSIMFLVRNINWESKEIMDNWQKTECYKDWSNYFTLNNIFEDFLKNNMNKLNLYYKEIKKIYDSEK